MRLVDIQPGDETIYMGLLTIEQKDLLVGILYSEDSYFNPVQDADENWVISREEMELCIYPEYDWIKELPLIPYNPIINPEDDLV